MQDDNNLNADESGRKPQGPTFAEKLGRQAKGVGAGISASVQTYAAHTQGGRAAFAAALSFVQEEIIFPRKRRIPGMDGLREMLTPEEYPALKGQGVIPRTLTGPQNGNQPVTIWERTGRPDRPHYILFHGQAGHWGDGGPAPKERYKDINIGRNNGLEFLEAIAQTGAGFTAVELPGFGKTPGEPGEKAFNDAIAVVLDDFVKKGIPGERIICGGESLGCASALEAATQLKKNHGIAAAQVTLMNPFASLADVSAEAFEIEPKLRYAPRFKPEFLDEHLLRHHFDNMAKLGDLDPHTAVHIGTSTGDSKIKPHHSQDLYDRAGAGRDSPNPKERIIGLGLDVVSTPYEGRNHRNWSPAHLLADTIEIYNQRHDLTDDKEMAAWLRTHDFAPQQVIEIDSKAKARDKAKAARVSGTALPLPGVGRA